MPAKKRTATSSHPNTNRPADPATVPMWWATGFLALFGILLSLFAAVGQQQLKPNQIRGSEEVLKSLSAELSVLKREAHKGKVPEALLRKEQEHIEQQTAEETERLTSLQRELEK